MSVVQVGIATCRGTVNGNCAHMHTLGNHLSGFLPTPLCQVCVCVCMVVLSLPLGSTLVKKSIRQMVTDGCDEASLMD